MNTGELLAAVKGEFPDLTDKTLREWVKDGFLQPPERVGMGTDGTPNKWATDSVHRIKVIKSVTTKRVDKSRARQALIAAGFFIGAQALRDELFKQLDEVCYVLACNQSDTMVDSGKVGAMLMNKDLGDVIKTALFAPTFLIDKFFAALQDSAEVVSIVHHHDDIDIDRTNNLVKLVHMGDDTPLTKVLQVFSFYNVKDDLKHAPDSLLLDAFNDSTNTFNIVHPIIGWLLGYDEYPPLPDSSLLAQYVQRRNTPIKLKRYEFEYLMRLVCIAGCLTVATRKDKLVKLLPNALTYVLMHSHYEVMESATGKLVISDGTNSISNNIAIDNLIKAEHAESVALANTLVK